MLQDVLICRYKVSTHENSGERETADLGAQCSSDFPANSSQYGQVHSAQVLYWKFWFCKVGGIAIAVIISSFQSPPTVSSSM